jgi:hypothetical protein
MGSLIDREISRLYILLKGDYIKISWLAANEKRYISNYVKFHIKRYIELRDNIRKNKGNENYQLENFPEYKFLLRIQSELEVKKKAGPSTSELALIAFYNGEKIPRGKGNPTKLYLRFKHYEAKGQDFNRVGPEDSPISNKYKVELFERVIANDKLSSEGKGKAQKEFQRLKKNIKGFVYFDRDLKDLKI